MHPDRALPQSGRPTFNRRMPATGADAARAPIASGRTMARNSTPETLPASADAPNFDWREWVSFVGSVLGTALVVSVVLGGVVLLLGAAS